MINLCFNYAEPRLQMLQAIIITANGNTDPEHTRWKSDHYTDTTLKHAGLSFLSVCVCLHACAGDLSDHGSLVSGLTVDTGIHGVQGLIKGRVLGAVCVFPPKHFQASLGDTEHTTMQVPAAAVVPYCLGNKDKKNECMFHIDTLFLDISESWLKSWIWNQWI